MQIYKTIFILKGHAALNGASETPLSKHRGGVRKYSSNSFMSKGGDLQK